MSDDKVCVLGMGFIGLTLSVTLAEVGLDVLGVDIQPEVVNTLQKNKCHFFEPGLDESLKKFGGKNLKFSLTISDKSYSYYIICVATPVDKTSNKPELKHIKNATHSILPYIKKGDTIILRSTIPMGTSRNLVIHMIKSETGLKAGIDFFFGFVPERTVEGNALYEQKHIPQIIGAFNEESAQKISKLFSKFNKKLIYVPDIEHAELCKIIDNTYRDVTFAYANQIAMICEELGLDFYQVRQACNTDYKRNNIPMPSPGVGGACLTKDPYIFIELCKKININSELIMAAREINKLMTSRLGEKILSELSALGKAVNSAKLFIMGFAYKGEPETDDIRSSTTIDLINFLKPFASRLYGYDAIVKKQAIESTGVVSCSIKDGFKDADVVVIMNSHKSHKNLDIKELSKKSNNPLIFIDCWNLYAKKQIQSYGNIRYSSIGLY